MGVQEAGNHQEDEPILPGASRHMGVTGPHGSHLGKRGAPTPDVLLQGAQRGEIGSDEAFEIATIDQGAGSGTEYLTTKRST